MNVNNANFARLQFFNWLQETFPAVAQGALEIASEPAQLSGLGEEAAAGGSFWEKLISGAAGLGTAYLTYQNQRDVLKLNIERAKAGQPPLDVATTAPVIRTEIDIDPALAQDLMSNVGATVNRNMLIIAGVGLAAILFIGRK